MASIFTYDPDPPRVSSPWLTPTGTPKASTPQPVEGNEATPVSGLLADYGVNRLGAEPQDGPIEYKLHLLLRPRRKYISSTTGNVTPGSQQHRHQPSNQPLSRDSGPVLAPSNQSRQSRLSSLATQLLWRLQQSSPYHASSSTSDLVMPQLPESERLDVPIQPRKLVAGLEESRGALYEIGVSDDGTFIGLTKDEMDESLTNLRSMASSLGCIVRVLRMVVVGECQWYQPTVTPNGSAGLATKDKDTPPIQLPSGDRCGACQKGKLYVAEALVLPDLSASKNAEGKVEGLGLTNPMALPMDQLDIGSSDEHVTRYSSEQLRVTLTGPTTSGKSSLLGTLSTATLDNGRGKSRLSLLKHRHEIVSGVTSSVAQELIGYTDELEVINYASGNVSSWTDIHSAAHTGRLVFFSDCPGYLKHRRTILRGLIGWAPHWTLLCISANDGESTAPGYATPSAIDLAGAHLELCLKLETPLAIVITKLDLASKVALRATLLRILSAIKAAGRKPEIVPPAQAKANQSSDLTSIPEEEDATVRGILESSKKGGLNSVVPIILTSAVKGTGISALHALLKNLPLPPIPTSHDYIGHALNPEQPSSLFHIEDIFGLPASQQALASQGPADNGVVIAGHLRFGDLSVGGTVVIGPFPAETDIEPQEQRSLSPSSFGVLKNGVSASVTEGEWHNARVVSLRNLRLPVHTLRSGQLGTIGVIFEPPEEEEVSNGPFERVPPATPRIRKGLVLAIPNQHTLSTGLTLQAASGLTASFEDGDINSVTPGSLVVLYVASVRASARVLRLVPHTNNAEHDLSADVFGLDEQAGTDEEPLVFGSDGITDVTFELMTHREWVELGSQVLVTPGGGHGLYSASERGEKGVAGLEGFVGKVIEVVD